MPRRHRVRCHRREIHGRSRLRHQQSQRHQGKLGTDQPGGCHRSFDCQADARYPLRGPYSVPRRQLLLNHLRFEQRRGRFWHNNGNRLGSLEARLLDQGRQDRSRQERQLHQLWQAGREQRRSLHGRPDHLGRAGTAGEAGGAQDRRNRHRRAAPRRRFRAQGLWRTQHRRG